ncbi:MAG: hypothetical protein VX589_06230, partial [Myxococcota bacterium]|nr:hypothetical protein [Myxococcota bacterium]
LEGASWPRLSARGTVAVGDIIKTVSTQSHHRTVGLSRLGRREIRLAPKDGTARDLLIIAATCLGHSNEIASVRVPNLGQVQFIPTDPPMSNQVQARISRPATSPTTGQTTHSDRSKPEVVTKPRPNEVKPESVTQPTRIEIKRRRSDKKQRKSRRTNTPFRPAYR